MRIIVSGTHASGKSTLISDFILRYPEYVVLPDPFELLDEADDSPGPSIFASQLRISSERLTTDPTADLISERGPLDFLAYLLAWSELSGEPIDEGFLERATLRAADAMRTVDLLVVLPLAGKDLIYVGVDEHLDLRDAMNDILLELIDDPDLVSDGLTVAEITGTPSARLVALETLVEGEATRAK